MGHLNKTTLIVTRTELAFAFAQWLEQTSPAVQTHISEQYHSATLTEIALQQADTLIKHLQNQQEEQEQ